MRDELKKHFKFGSNYRKYSENEVELALVGCSDSTKIKMYTALLKMEKKLLCELSE